MKLNLEKIPNSSGCYLFLDKFGKIIYVGKAKNLKKRIMSYFSKKELDSKTLALVNSIYGFDFIITKNEVEALILENNLIKKNSPKYNIDLKDSKRYAYLELTDEDFPRLIVSRATKSSGKLFGPFTSATSREYIKDLLIKTFKLRTCNKFPKRPCLRYSIGICNAPCVNKISKEKYKENIKSVESVLKGRINFMIKKLGKKMINFSRAKDYENALEFRNQISALKFLVEKQNMERQKKFDEDIVNYVVFNGKVYLLMFNVKEGVLENKKDFEFAETYNFLEEFLVQYYSESLVPKEIILPCKIDNSVIEFLKKKRKKKVNVIVPKIGDKKNLLELVKKNIEIQIFGNVERLKELKKKLNLQEFPNIIECFDVSHLSGTQVVGSMVQFRNGKSDKNNYRKFKLTNETNDDFYSIYEIIKRRYSRLQKEKKVFPDLIVVDGGAPQLGAGSKALRELNIKIPIIGLAKKEEEIYFPDGKVLKLNKKNKGLLLLMEIRDEAHRFALKYQRKRRGMKK